MGDENAACETRTEVEVVLSVSYSLILYLYIYCLFMSVKMHFSYFRLSWKFDDGPLYHDY